MLGEIKSRNPVLKKRNDKMERQNVSSSNISSIGYDDVQQILEVEFHGGRVYHYYDVPMYVYEELMDASSHGTYLSANVKGNYQYDQVG